MMTKKYILATILTGCLSLLTACHSEQATLPEKEQTQEYGTLNLKSLSLQLNSEPVVSRAEAAEDLSNFVVELYQTTPEEKKVQEWKYSEMPEVFTTQTGSYRVNAHSPAIEGAQFDAPYCEGESAVFEIKKDIVTEIEEITCTLKSIKVTIKYDENMKPLLGKDLKVQVTTGNEQLDFTPTETRSGFFHAQAESNEVKVVMSGTFDGDPEFTDTRSYADVKPGTELIVTYKLQDAGNPGNGGNMQPGLKIISEYEEVRVGTIVNPGDEDTIEDFGKPRIEGVDLDLDQPLTDLNRPVIINLIAPEKIAHVHVTISSDNKEFEGLVVEMFDASTFDLAEPVPGKQEEALKLLGFPIGDAVKGMEKVIFDITAFMEPLKMFAGTHSFHIKVTDFNNQSVEATLVIIVK